MVSNSSELMLYCLCSSNAGKELSGTAVDDSKSHLIYNTLDHSSDKLVVEFVIRSCLYVENLIAAAVYLDSTFHLYSK